LNQKTGLIPANELRIYRSYEVMLLKEFNLAQKEISFILLILLLVAFTMQL